MPRGHDQLAMRRGVEVGPSRAEGRGEDHGTAAGVLVQTGVPDHGAMIMVHDRAMIFLERGLRDSFSEREFVEFVKTFRTS